MHYFIEPSERFCGVGTANPLPEEDSEVQRGPHMSESNIEKTEPKFYLP